MGRALWKGPFVDGKLLTLFDQARRGLVDKNTGLITDSRMSTIIPQFLGYTFHVHNGKKFIPVRIVQEMIGCKLGEFSPTITKGEPKKIILNSRKKKK